MTAVPPTPVSDQPRRPRSRHPLRLRRSRDPQTDGGAQHHRGDGQQPRRATTRDEGNSGHRWSRGEGRRRWVRSTPAGPARTRRGTPLASGADPAAAQQPAGEDPTERVPAIHTSAWTDVLGPRGVSQPATAAATAASRTARPSLTRRSDRSCSAIIWMGPRADGWIDRCTVDIARAPLEAWPMATGNRTEVLIGSRG